MSKRVFIQVEYTELNYGFLLKKQAEFIVPVENVTVNQDGSLRIIPNGKKRSETFATSMIREYREIN